MRTFTFVVAAITIFYMLIPALTFAAKPQDTGARLVSTIVMVVIVAGVGWIIITILNKIKRK